MKASKRTKSALITSIISLVLCFTMLLGTTYAWFTDTASTGVNKIQAGTLDVQLLNANGTQNIEGQSLKFVKDNNAPVGEQVLWEPGCTYRTEGFQIKNNGSLKLKFKITVNGVVGGSAALLNVIDFYLTGDPNTLTTTAASFNGEYTLEPNTKWALNGSDTIYLVGKMKTDAGNEYQNATLEGVAITLTATQEVGEYDSTGNDYDSAAEYPVAVPVTVAVDTGNLVAAPVTAASSATVGTTPVAKVTVPIGVAVETGVTQLNLSVDEAAAPGNYVVAAGTDSMTFDVKLDGLASGNGTAVTVELYVGVGLSGVKLYHNGTEEVSGITYNPATGVLTFSTTSFSPFTVQYDVKTVSTDAELEAALDSTTTVIVVTDDVTFDWGGNSYENSNALKLQNKIIRGATGSETITFQGYGSANPIKNATFCNITIADQTVGDVEGSWNHGYLEFENLTAKDVNFANVIMVSGENNSLTNCKFIGKDAKLGEGQAYCVIVNGGTAKFESCYFTGDRGLTTKWEDPNDGAAKGIAYVNNCTFENLTHKPGVANKGVVHITNSTFINTQPGDFNNYIWEDNEPATNSNNTVING